MSVPAGRSAQYPYRSNSYAGSLTRSLLRSTERCSAFVQKTTRRYPLVPITFLVKAARIRPASASAPRRSLPAAAGDPDKTFGHDAHWRET